MLRVFVISIKQVILGQKLLYICANVLLPLLIIAATSPVAVTLTMIKYRFGDVTVNLHLPLPCAYAETTSMYCAYFVGFVLETRSDVDMFPPLG